LALPDEMIYPAADRLFRKNPSNANLGLLEGGPGEDTQTLGATPRKIYRILKKRPGVNETGHAKFGV